MPRTSEQESESELDAYLPESLRSIDDPQTAIPKVAKNPAMMAQIESAAQCVPSGHRLIRGDSRDIRGIEPESVHLILTSPPYWTLKKYRDCRGQLGELEEYDDFLSELDKVWKHCRELLVPGGRLICVVGDVCLSRKSNGRHMVVPLHASIQEHCRRLGFDNLAPIIWHKIANAAYEVESGSGFLGKPYEPNAVIKNDIEFILMERKPGGYRKPAIQTKVLSVISESNHRKWFQQIWTGVTGASTRNHPAPYPLELAVRLIRMFSFVGDTVLDPFMGTATTNVAAANWGRNSIGIEVDPHYFEIGRKRLDDLASDMFTRITIDVTK